VVDTKFIDSSGGKEIGVVAQRENVRRRR